MHRRRVVLAAGTALAGVLCGCGSSLTPPATTGAPATSARTADPATPATATPAASTTPAATIGQGPRRSPAVPPSPLGGFPATIDDVALARAVHAAVAASGGCTVTASVSAARLSITYAPRPTLAEGFVDEAWGSGTLTAGALHARFVAHWLAAVEGSVWVDDGTSAGGKAWVQVPASMLGLRDVEAVRAHPLLSLVTLLRQVAPDVAGMGASLTMSHHAQLVGTETIDGAATGHYTWTTARGRREDVWLGHDWLPRRHLAPYDGATPATITIGYRGWGSPQPAVQAPPQDQVTVAPTSRP